jgi:hypothetical protein
MSSSERVTIQISHSLDEDGDFDAFTNVSVDILLDQTKKKVGTIQATIINRKKIPTNYFLSAMNSHSSSSSSGELQKRIIGTTATTYLFEPRRGRTRLASLAKYEDDDEEFDILYIHSLRIMIDDDDDCKVQHHHHEKEDSNNNNSIRAIALCQLLHHPLIQGSSSSSNNNNMVSWNVSCAVYILDPYEAMTTAERKTYDEKRKQQLKFCSAGATQQQRPAAASPPPDPKHEEARQQQEQDLKMDALARADADPFLRNGFFQDRAVAQIGRDAARILVASRGHWIRQQQQPTSTSMLRLSHLQAAHHQIRLPPSLTGLDKALFSLVAESSTFQHLRLDTMMNPRPPQTTRGGGAARDMLLLEDDPAAQQQEVTRICSEITKLTNQGASIARSHVLHAACAANAITIIAVGLVRFLLELDPSSIHGRDDQNFTPLMVAAGDAAGRGRRYNRCLGIADDTRVVDYLLAKGARKDDQDNYGMTAFGHLKKIIDGNQMMGLVQESTACCWSSLPVQIEALKDKLMPAGGPTDSDLKGESATTAVAGFVDYAWEDFEFDDEDDGDY